MQLYIYMYRLRLRHILPLGLLATLLVLSACSTKKNTAGTRFWHSFTAKYNTFYNASQAYKEGIEAKEKGNSDNYTARLPFFLVGNEKSAQLGKSNFETAVEKCEKAIQLHSIKKRPEVNPSKARSEKTKQYLARREFNPFLKNAWLLMGQAQFQEGEFLEAAATFSYITRLYAPEPDVVQEARTWLARCYAQLDWFYDAEDVLTKLEREEIPRKFLQERDATKADLLLRQERFEEALPYLERATKKEPRRLQRARLYFLQGQVQQLLGNNPAAYKALSKCVRQNPPYQLAFNARILQTEVLSGGGQGRKMIGTLKRMARSDKNKDYLDQVYYAMGNIYLAQADTAEAIGCYEKGRAKATRAGIEKGVLLLRLGEVYWDKGRYDKAQTCYTEAIGLLDKKRKDYPDILKRSKILDKLVPYTSAVFLQDSLQELSRMSEDDRNAAIDRVIEELKKKEKEEAKAKKDSAAQARQQAGGELPDMGGGTQTSRPNTANQQSNQMWYFYNPMLVSQGKQDFQKRWGARKNEDDWRRSNKTVVQMDDGGGVDYDALDSIEAAQDSIDALEEKADSVLAPEDDPHCREYYLKQIPFTAEQKEASNLIIMDGLYNAGLIEKDELEDFPLASRTLTRIVRQYPEYEKIYDTYYQLFLLYSRWDKPDEADYYKGMMAQVNPDSALTKRILDPNFLTDARNAKAREAKLYAETYDAYKASDVSGVSKGFQISEQLFADGALRPKFIFLHALSRIGSADNKDIANELRELVKTYPKNDVSELAGLIVRGIDEGRELGSGNYDFGSLWGRRSAASSADSLATDSTGLSAEKDTKYVFITAYPRDSVDDNQLLYQIAHYNFTGFHIRRFEIEKVVETLTPTAKKEADADVPALVQFRIRGLKNYDEALAYARGLYQEPALAEMLRKTRIFLISEDNLKLIGRRYSFEDYAAFADSVFTLEPDTTLTNARIDAGGDTEQQYEERLPEIYPLQPKVKPADDKKEDADKKEDDAATPATPPATNEQTAGEPVTPVGPDDDSFPADEPAPKPQQPVEDETVEDVPAEQPAKPETPSPAEETVPDDEPATPSTPAPPAPKEEEETKPVEPAKPVQDTKPAEPAKPTPPAEPEDSYPDDEEDSYPDDEEGEVNPLLPQPVEEEEEPAKPATPAPSAPQKEEKKEEEVPVETPQKPAAPSTPQQPAEEDDGEWFPA